LPAIALFLVEGAAFTESHVVYYVVDVYHAYAV
jgi:hypothetical protein